MTRSASKPHRLSEREARVLALVPIGIDADDNGDPMRAPRYRYQGADGRTAAALWRRGLLTYRSTNPFGRDNGGLLDLTPEGAEALAGNREAS